MNYNTRKGEVGNCEVFTKVGGCSDFSHRYNWKTLAFNVQAVMLFSITHFISEISLNIMLNNIDNVQEYEEKCEEQFQLLNTSLLLYML